MKLEPQYPYQDAKPVRETFLSPLQTANKHARDVVERLRLLADRLDGGAPEGESVGGPAGFAPGIFGEVRSRSDEINDALNEAEAILARLERSLP